MGNEDSRAQGVRRAFWPKLAGNLARLPFAEDVVAAYYCAVDLATPLRAKGILMAALAYFILPLDAVPDFILGLGFTDDLAVLMAAFGVIRAHLTDQHRERAREALDRLRRGERISA
jgi:uncharacterized membrane protein YkvA (DUF1232 family)